MIYKEYDWYGKEGGAIKARSWRPDTGMPVKGVVVFVHGLGEHSKRYADFANYLVNKDFAALAFDLRGHGETEGKRGHSENYENLLYQIDQALENASKFFPGEPKFTYGHSLGGNLVLNHTILHHPRVQGVIVSAPWLRTGKPLATKDIWMGKIGSVLLPSFTQANGLDLNNLSRDKAVIENYKQDPLVHDKISARLFYSAYKQAAFALNNADEIDVPLLLMHGTDDLLTDPTASEEFVNSVSNKDITFKQWNGFYHELHNEPEKQEVYDYVIDWMLKKINR